MHTKPHDDIDKFPEGGPVDNTYTGEERKLMADEFLINVFCDTKTGENATLFETEWERAQNNPLLDHVVTTSEHIRRLWIRAKKDKPA